MRHACSRRNFLGLAAAAAGGAIIRPSRAFALATDKGASPVMGIQSYTLRAFSPDKVLEQAQALGLGSVEFFNAHFPVSSTDEQIQSMLRKANAAGVKLLARGVDAFSKDHEANRKYFEFAKRAGIRNISADPAEDSFDSLDKLVGEYKIRIAIHNHGPGSRYDKVADVLNAIQGHHPSIGACADLGHYIRSGEDPVRVINLLKGRLYGIHLKDFAEQKAQAKGVILGQGHLDVAGVLRALRKVEFPADGALSLEYEEKPEDPIADVKQCLAVVSEAQRKVDAEG